MASITSLNVLVGRHSWAGHVSGGTVIEKEDPMINFDPEAGQCSETRRKDASITKKTGASPFGKENGMVGPNRNRANNTVLSK